LVCGHGIAETGRGITVTISSGGLWFTTDNLLTAGIPVEISLNWQVMPNDSCPMQLERSMSIQLRMRSLLLDS